MSRYIVLLVKITDPLKPELFMPFVEASDAEAAAQAALDFYGCSEGSAAVLDVWDEPGYCNYLAQFLEGYETPDICVPTDYAD